MDKIEQSKADYRLQMCFCSAASVVSGFATPPTLAPQPPLFMGLSRQEYWSELPYPPPGDLNSGICLPPPLQCRQILDL